MGDILERAVHQKPVYQLEWPYIHITAKDVLLALCKTKRISLTSGPVCCTGGKVFTRELLLIVLH